MVDIVPYWNDPDIVDIHTTYDHANAQALPETAVENRASFHQWYEFHTLEAGEQITFHEGAAAAAAGATAGRGICASTPPRTALPPV